MKSTVKTDEKGRTLHVLEGMPIEFKALFGSVSSGKPTEQRVVETESKKKTGFRTAC